MSFGEILFIYRARLRERAIVVQDLLAVLGIAVGVALLFASQVAGTSLDSSVRELSKQLVGATQYQLDARGPEGVSERVAGEAQSLPGVRAALPLLEQQASVIGPRGRASVDLLGGDPRLAQVGGPLLRRFSSGRLAFQEAIALPAALAAQIGAGPPLVPAGALQHTRARAVGLPAAGLARVRPIELQIGAHVVRTLLGITLLEAEVGALADSRVALAPIAYVQRVAGMRGRVSRVFIQVQPGRQAMARASLGRLAVARRLNLEPADFDATPVRGRLRSGPAERGPVLRDQRDRRVPVRVQRDAADGARAPPHDRGDAPPRRDPHDDRPGAEFDALVIGVLACALGLLFGELLSIEVFHAQPGYLAFAFPVGSQRVVTWTTVALAVGAGMLAAFVGVLAPLRDILARPLRIAARRSSALPAAGACSASPLGTCLPGVHDADRAGFPCPRRPRLEASR